MEKLSRDGHKVCFCALKDDCSSILVRKGFEHFPITLNRKTLNPMLELNTIFDLLRIYKSEKPDVVLHFTPKLNIYGAIAANFAGASCINTITGLGYVFTGNKFFSAALVKLLYRISGAIAVKTFFQNTDDMGFFLKERLVPKSKAVLVKGSGVDTAYFSPAGREEGGGDKEKRFIFLLYGRLLTDKGVGEFVRAASILKKELSWAEFWLLGSVDNGNPASIDMGQLRRWQSDETIKYYESTSDVKPFLNRADCIVLPSYREGMPKSLLEAMAMEKPIITTDVPGCRDIIEDDINGFMVPARDHAALASAMRKMAMLPGHVRLKMGEAGRRKAVNEFSEKKVIETYVDNIAACHKIRR